MGAEPLLDVSDHAFEQRQCRLGFTASNDVAAHVDPRAELDVADLVLSAQLGRLAVELQCALEITKLLMEPTQAVGDPADVEMVLSFAGLDETVVEHGARLGIKAAPDVSQTETPLPEPLVVLVVDSLGLSRHPVLDLDGLAELAPPVVEATEEPEAVQIQIGRTERLAETHGLLEHPGPRPARRTRNARCPGWPEPWSESGRPRSPGRWLRPLPRSVPPPVGAPTTVCS